MKMEVNIEVLREIIDYTWKLEKKIREELLQNFMSLSKHHSELSIIIDKLIDMQVSLEIQSHKLENEHIQQGERVRTRKGDSTNKISDYMSPQSLQAINGDGSPAGVENVQEAKDEV